MNHVTIKGAKGGSSSFKQTPDNLRSNDTFEGVLGVCIGPIKGPTRGLKSIKIDGTAIENETGQLNFTDFVATLGNGDPAQFPQVVQLKLGAGAAPTQVGTTLINTDGVAVPATKTMNNLNAEFMDLRFIVNQLFRQDAKGIYDLTATLKIELKPVGSTQWVNPTIGTPNGNYNEQGYQFEGLNGAMLKMLVPESYYDSDGSPVSGRENYAITGKTTGPAVYELRIALPNTGAYADTAWDVRVTLLERDKYTGGKDNTDSEVRSIQWESIAAVYGKTMFEHEDTRGVAWLQLYGKASDQLTGVPEVIGEFDTKIVQVPPSTIFDPETRQYTTGTWDGSWANAYTNDPAWLISNVISDSLAGISLIAPGSYLNKWDALEMSKWCSERVPDGAGGTHPRYSLNYAIRDPMKAEEFIRYLAGAVGGLAWDQGNGEWRVKMDKPEVPVDLFTLDNIEGEFLWSNTDVDTRYNDITMSFLNEEMDYREDRVRVVNNASIAAIGRKPTTLVAVGCTNRQEALRRALMRLLSATGETRVVNFVTNRRGRNVEHLDTILIADGDLGDLDKRTHGRTVAIASDRQTITLRDTVYLAPGVSYTLRYAVSNPEYFPSTATQPTSPDWKKPTITQTRTITNAGSATGQVRTLTLDEPLPEGVSDNLAIALEATDLVTLPRLFRVTNVTFDDDGERVAISALEVKTDKWVLSDNVSKQDTVFVDLRGAVPMPTLVTNHNLLSLHTGPSDTGVITSLLAEWQRPAGAFVAGFRVQHSVNGGSLSTVIEKTQFPSWELTNPPPGTHRVEICTVSRDGRYSPPLVAQLLVASGPDQTRPALGQLWKDGDPIDPTYAYLKGDLVVDQGATWIFTSDAVWDGTMPPELPAQENGWWRQIKDATSSQLTLDNTSFTVTADSSGTVQEGQLPKVGRANYIVGTADVSANVTWSVVPSNCTGSIDTDGVWEIDTMGSGTTGYLDVVGVFNGISLTKRVTITKSIAGSTGGGDGTSSSVSSFGSVSSTSYAADPVTTGLITTTASGKLTFSADLFYDVASASKINRVISVSGKIVYRLGTTGAWTDACPDTASVQEAFAPAYNTNIEPDSEQQTGELVISPVTIAGLTASTAYQFGILLRKAYGNATGTTPYGTLTAQVTA